MSGNECCCKGLSRHIRKERLRTAPTLRCHKYILAGASQLLCYRLRCAEQAEGVHASLLRRQGSSGKHGVLQSWGFQLCCVSRCRAASKSLRNAAWRASALASRCTLLRQSEAGRATPSPPSSPSRHFERAAMRMLSVGLDMTGIAGMGSGPEGSSFGRHDHHCWSLSSDARLHDRRKLCPDAS